VKRAVTASSGRILLAAVACALLGAAQEPSPALERERAAARAELTRVAEGFAEVRELRARYVQHQESLLLEEPLVSRGTLHLRADPGCLVLELSEPRPVQIRSDATSHLVYHPELKRAERFLFESNHAARALLACFSADLAQVESLFEIAGYVASEPAAEGEPPLGRLRLLPRNEEVRAVLTSLELELDLARHLPASLVQRNPEGEELRLSLSQIVLNPERAPGEVPIFDRPLPADVTVVERRVPSPRK
jgi:hypothetical protein